MAGGDGGDSGAPSSVAESELLAIFTIVLILALQILAAWTEARVERHVHMQEMLRMMYKELAILGVVALGLFLLDTAGLELSSGAKHAFEVLHLTLFAVAVTYAAAVLGLVSFSRQVSSRWTEIEERDVSQTESWHAEMEVYRDEYGSMSLWGALNACRRCNFLGCWRILQLSEVVNFDTIRARFLEENNLPVYFLLSVYLKKAKQHVFLELTEVGISLWVALAVVLAVDLWLRALIPPYRDDASLPAVISGVGAVVAIFGISVAVYMHRVVAILRKSHLEVLGEETPDNPAPLLRAPSARAMNLAAGPGRDVDKVHLPSRRGTVVLGSRRWSTANSLLSEARRAVQIAQEMGLTAASHPHQQHQPSVDDTPADSPLPPKSVNSSKDDRDDDDDEDKEPPTIQPERSLSGTISTMQRRRSFLVLPSSSVTGSSTFRRKHSATNLSTPTTLPAGSPRRRPRSKLRNTSVIAETTVEEEEKEAVSEIDTEHENNTSIQSPRSQPTLPPRPRRSSVDETAANTTADVINTRRTQSAWTAEQQGLSKRSINTEERKHDQSSGGGSKERKHDQSSGGGSKSPQNSGSKERNHDQSSGGGSKTPQNMGSKSPQNTGSKSPQNTGSKSPQNIDSAKRSGAPPPIRAPERTETFVEEEGLEEGGEVRMHQRDLFPFGNPRLILAALQTVVFLAALVVSVTITILVDHATGYATVPTGSLVVLVMFNLGMVVCLCVAVTDVVPLYVMATHTGELVDDRLLTIALRKSQARHLSAVTRLVRRAIRQARTNGSSASLSVSMIPALLAQLEEAASGVARGAAPSISAEPHHHRKTDQNPDQAGTLTYRPRASTMDLVRRSSHISASRAKPKSNFHPTGDSSRMSFSTFLSRVYRLIYRTSAGRTVLGSLVLMALIFGAVAANDSLEKPLVRTSFWIAASLVWSFFCTMMIFRILYTPQQYLCHRHHHHHLVHHSRTPSHHHHHTSTTRFYSQSHGLVTATASSLPHSADHRWRSATDVDVSSSHLPQVTPHHSMPPPTPQFMSPREGANPNHNNTARPIHIEDAIREEMFVESSSSEDEVRSRARRRMAVTSKTEQPFPPSDTESEDQQSEFQPPPSEPHHWYSSSSSSSSAGSDLESVYNDASDNNDEESGSQRMNDDGNIRIDRRDNAGVRASDIVVGDNDPKSTTNTKRKRTTWATQPPPSTTRHRKQHTPQSTQDRITSISDCLFRVRWLGVMDLVAVLISTIVVTTRVAVLGTNAWDPTLLPQVPTGILLILVLRLPRIINFTRLLRGQDLDVNEAGHEKKPLARTHVDELIL